MNLLRKLRAEEARALEMKKVLNEEMVEAEPKVKEVLLAALRINPRLVDGDECKAALKQCSRIEREAVALYVYGLQSTTLKVDVNQS